MIGVDPTAVMLRFAGLLTKPSADVRYEIGSAESLPVPEETASVVWTIASVHHWSDLDAGLTEARRVLKPGGRLVAIERGAVPGAHGHASHGWTEDQASAFASLCEKHGFVDAQVGRHKRSRRNALSVAAQVI